MPRKKSVEAVQLPAIPAPEGMAQAPAATALLGANAPAAAALAPILAMGGLSGLPLRLNRSITVAKGMKMNISRQGISFTLNLGNGMKMNSGPKGTVIFGGPKGVRIRQKL